METEIATKLEFEDLETVTSEDIALEVHILSSLFFVFILTYEITNVKSL